MFTGIIEEVGALRSATSAMGGLNLEVATSPEFATGVAVGDSVCVNGVCLTAIKSTRGLCVFQAVEETVGRSTLSSLRPGSRLNLERALLPTSRLGGHFVLGHVDCKGVVEEVVPAGLEHLLSVRLPEDAAALCIPKGSIALDGVSLTIAALKGSLVSVAVIPHTWENTNLSALSRGAAINVEVDMIGKYIRKFVESMRSNGGKPAKSSMDEDFLRKHGFA